MATTDFKRAWVKAQSMTGHTSVRKLAPMLRSRSPARRLQALLLMRRQLEAGSGAAAYLQLARPHIQDQSHHCRWQALIVVSRFIKSNPEAVWQATRRYGASPSQDVRAGIATVLLEHLLEHRASRYLPRVRAELARGGRLFADMVALCSPLGSARTQRSIRQVVKEAARRASAT